MLKKTAVLILVVAAGWACLTSFKPPSFRIESLPPGLVTELTLEQRIMLEEAWARVKQGDAKGAEKLFLRLGQASPFYNAGLGYVAFLQDQYPQAEAYFQESLRRHPDLGLSHLGLGQLYQATSREELAFNEYMEVLKTEPENAWVLEQSEAIRRRQTEALLREGVALFEQGQLEPSKAAFNKALHYSPNSLEAHLNLARLNKTENQTENALLHLKAAAAIDAKNKNVLEEYGDMAYRSGQWGRSLEAYEKLAELEPRNKDYQSRIESLKNRLGIIELPSQYDMIPSSAAITREETAALIGVKLKDYLGDAGDKPRVIIDVATSWASKFILKVASLGLMEAYGNHTFEPQRAMTRTEMAKVLMNLVEFLSRRGFRFIRQYPPHMIRISDVSSDNIFYQPIADVVALELMELGPDKSFRPQQGISGREAIKIFDLILALLK
jgi:tetratricopeptide (TPR) repeat protein